MIEFSRSPETIPFGPGPGAINGQDRERILSTLHDVFRSPAALAYYGSLTPNGGFGNEGNTYHHDKASGKTVNAMGLPSLSVESAVPVMKEAQKIADYYGKELIVSVSPAKGDDPESVIPEMVDRVFSAGVRRVEVNYSCPNKISDDGIAREPVLSYDPGRVFATREALLKKVGKDKDIIEKWAPFFAPDLGRDYSSEFSRIVDDLMAAPEGIGGLAISNTIMGIDLLLDDGSHALDIITRKNEWGLETVTHSHTGGMSGPYVAQFMRDELSTVRSSIPGYMAVISAGGVATGAEILAREELEADFSVGVTVFWEGKKAGRSYGRTMTMLAEEYSELAA